jgi:hypothetical protein
MVAPINNSNTITTLQRATPQPTINQTANRQVAQAVLNRTPVPNKTVDKNLTLASANANPSPNLPRGSIVDKLV